MPRRGDLLEQRLDVGAQELGRAMTGGADEMEVPRMAVGRLEARAAFAEVDLAGDAGADHPLQRPIDGGAADARRLAAHEIEQIVGADVPFLAQEHLQHRDRVWKSACRLPDAGTRGQEGDGPFGELVDW